MSYTMIMLSIVIIILLYFLIINKTGNKDSHISSTQEPDEEFEYFSYWSEKGEGKIKAIEDRAMRIALSEGGECVDDFDFEKDQQIYFLIDGPHSHDFYGKYIDDENKLLQREIEIGKLFPEWMKKDDDGEFFDYDRWLETSLSEKRDVILLIYQSGEKIFNRAKLLDFGIYKRYSNNVDYALPDIYPQKYIDILRTSHYSNNEEELNWQDFEVNVRDKFINEGFKASLTSSGPDYGADVIAESNSLKLAVQVKHYSNSVGVKAVNEVLGAMSYYDCDGGVVVTNSKYTDKAHNLARASNVHLLHIDQVEVFAKDVLTGRISL